MTDLAVVREHLRDQYVGVFDDEMVERHIREYVGLDVARDQARWVRTLCGDGGGRLLDVGCGYGSFVLAAVEAGFDARGIDIASFELAYARHRDDGSGGDTRRYVQASALSLPFADDTYDVVTMWNLLEHVPDADASLAEVARVLRPGGTLVAIAPNYASFRREAHYHVPWVPLLPRRLAVSYLGLLRRDPGFLRSSIHYTTNRRLLRSMRGAGLVPTDPLAFKLDHPEAIDGGRARRLVDSARRWHVLGLAAAAMRVRFANPWRATVFVAARKAGS